MRRGRLPVQSGRKRAFQDQEPSLDFDARAAAVAAEPVAGQHPMARHDHRNRVRSHDLADGPGRQDVVGCPQAAALRELAVAGRLPVSDRCGERLQHVALLPGRGRPVDRQVESLPVATEVLGELHRGRRRLARDGHRYPRALGRTGRARRRRGRSQRRSRQPAWIPVPRKARPSEHSAGCACSAARRVSEPSASRRADRLRGSRSVRSRR